MAAGLSRDNSSVMGREAEPANFQPLQRRGFGGRGTARPPPLSHQGRYCYGKTPIATCIWHAAGGEAEIDAGLAVGHPAPDGRSRSGQV